MLVGIEFKKLVDSLKTYLENAFIRKVYFTKDSFIFSIYKKGFGNFYLYILLKNLTFFVSKSRYFSEDISRKYRDLLRKYLFGRKIKRVEQYMYDRIILIELEDVDIVIELINPPNLIIKDKNNKILFCFREYSFRDREIRLGKIYIFPKNARKFSPDNTNIDELYEYLTEKYKGKTIAQAIGVEFGLGKKYTDLFFEKFKFPKEIKVENVTKEQLFELFEKYREFYESLDVSFESIEKEYVNYFKEEKPKSKKHKREEEIKKKIEELENKVNFIYQNLYELERIRKSVLLGNIPENVKFDGKSFEVNCFRFDINKKISLQMSEIYDKIKKLRERLEKLKEMEVKSKKKIKVKFPNKWFSKFLWFKTLSGLIAVAGRNAEENEKIVKKHFSEKDLGFHANVHGSPFAILKNGINASEKDKEEVARFVGVFSSAWKIGLKSVDVYYFTKDQVSKEAPSGEYLKKGGFMIYGEKNWIRNIDLFMVVGIKGEKCVWGFSRDLTKFLDRYVIIVPGKESKIKLAREIEKILNVRKKDLIKILPSTGSLIL